ncbi:MAG: phage holin family protein [Sinobacteraceae bacterium]|nr:phage holin family protein [Nevskiaceae bacterium]
MGAGGRRADGPSPAGMIVATVVASADSWKEPSVATREAQIPIHDDNLQAQGAIDLLKRLVDELTTLFRQEIALAKAEITASLTKLVMAVAALAGGALVLFAGLLVLLAAAVLALALVVAPWLAALIIGGAVTLIGVIMVMAGIKGVNPDKLKPRRSPESLRKDKELLKRSAS